MYDLFVMTFLTKANHFFLCKESFVLVKYCFGDFFSYQIAVIMRTIDISVMDFEF